MNTVHKNAACNPNASSHPRFELASARAWQTASVTARIRL
jgi:hypothetical protein